MQRNDSRLSPSRPLSLYLHLPFCVRKCRYCDFVSGPAPSVEQRDYVSLLRRELAARAAGYGRCADAPRAVDSIFFGGGTPSILEPSLLAFLLTDIRDLFLVEEGAEITLEANPGTLSPQALAVYKKAGVNRLSLGVQSFRDEELALLGRIHDSAQAKESVRLVREAGFCNINLDLMSGLPGQTASAFASSLEEALALKPEHLSVYSLIPEEGTPLGDAYLEGTWRDQGLPPLPSEEEERNMVHATARRLKAAGYGQYEISNYAKPGFACRHNTGYWTGHDYLGLGRAAASKIGNIRFTNPASQQEYAAWVEEVESTAHAAPAKTQEVLSREEEMEEFCFLGLRMTAGISKRAFREAFGEELEARYGAVMAQHKQNGLLQEEDDRVFLTERGRDLANRVMADFLQ